MAKKAIFPTGMTEKEALSLDDLLMLQDGQNLGTDPNTATFRKLMALFTGGIDEQEERLINGKELFERFSGLDMANVKNLNNVPELKVAMSELLRLDVSAFNMLRYICCKVSADNADFPEELRETDTAAYLFTNRNNINGIQVLIGADSGIFFSRRLNGGKLSDWAAVSGGINYATFSLDPDSGNLVMHTAPGYRGAWFTIEENYLYVEIK